MIDSESLLYTGTTGFLTCITSNAPLFEKRGEHCYMFFLSIHKHNHQIVYKLLQKTQTRGCAIPAESSDSSDRDKSYLIKLLTNNNLSVITEIQLSNNNNLEGL